MRDRTDAVQRSRAILALAAACALWFAQPVAGADFNFPMSTQIPTLASEGDTMGTAGGYPDQLFPSAIWGPVTDVDVSLTGIGHNNPDDLDVLLVGPNGVGVILMSDACGINDFFPNDFTWSDQFANSMPDSAACNGINVRPTDYNDGADTWPPSFPGPHASPPVLNVFNGINASGAWRLFIRDDALNGTGTINGTWTLKLTTGPYVMALPTGSGTSGAAAPYPLTVPITTSGIVTKVEPQLNGIYHRIPDDLDLVLQSPSGQTATLMSDACGSVNAHNQTWRWEDDATAAMPDNGTCANGSHRPSDYAPADTLPAPAPAGPHPASLAVFGGTQAQGDWKLWASDDAASNTGFTTGNLSLTLETRDPLAAKLTESSVGVDEGGTARLTIDRSGAAPRGTGTVRVQTAAGSAAPGEDFTAVDRVVEFGPDETSETVEIPIVADGRGETAETFTVALSEAGGDATLGTPTTATVTIGASAGPPAAGAAGTLPAPISGLTTPPRLADFANAFRMPGSRRCVRRGSRLRFTATPPRGARYVRTEMRVNGRRVLTRTAARADDPIRLRVRSRRTRVAITVRTADGRRGTAAKTYRSCRRR